MKSLSIKLAMAALAAALSFAPVAPALIGTAHAESLVHENRDRDAALAATSRQEWTTGTIQHPRQFWSTHGNSH